MLPKIRRASPAKPRGRLKEKALYGWHSRRQRNLPRMVRRFDRVFGEYSKLSRDVYNEAASRIPDLKIEIIKGPEKAEATVSFSKQFKAADARRLLNYLEARTARLNILSKKIQNIELQVSYEEAKNIGERKAQAGEAAEELERIKAKYKDDAQVRLQAVLETVGQYIQHFTGPAKIEP